MKLIIYIYLIHNYFCIIFLMILKTRLKILNEGCCLVTKVVIEKLTIIKTPRLFFLNDEWRLSGDNQFLYYSSTKFTRRRQKVMIILHSLRAYEQITVQYSNFATLTNQESGATFLTNVKFTCYSVGDLLQCSLKGLKYWELKPTDWNSM